MTSKLDDLLPVIRSAGPAGLGFDALKKQFTGRSKASVTQLRMMLDALLRKGTIREKEGKVEHYVVPVRGPAAEPPKARRLDGVLPAIRKAEDAGLSFVELQGAFPGRSKVSEAELREALAGLAGKDLIRVLDDGGTERYFAAGRGPSARTVGAAVVSLVHQSGLRLLTVAALKKGLTALEAPLLEEALREALLGKEIVELMCGTTKCYLHRDIAAELFAFNRKPAVPAAVAAATAATATATATTPTTRKLTMDAVLPAYRRLKEEQGGFSGVKILDLMKALNLPKEAVHPLLIEEVKAGRVTIHRSSSVELPRDVTDAGIRLPGFSDPFVSFAVKRDK